MKKIIITLAFLALGLFVPVDTSAGTVIICPSGDRYKCYTVESSNGSSTTVFKGDGESTLRRVPVN
jgi:hypothetical protein